ncbi:MAG: hypothetical protein B7Z47_07625, partial [Chthoniobacter sp. 12-60-6]
ASGWRSNKPDAYVHAAWHVVKSAAYKERGIYSVLAFVALAKKAALRKHQALRFADAISRNVMCLWILSRSRRDHSR